MQSTPQMIRQQRGLVNKYSLDSIRKPSPKHKLKPKRVRSRASKLDLLDESLTSFPRLNSLEGGSTGSDTESLRIVEDYIPDASGSATATTSHNDPNSPKDSVNTTSHCDNEKITTKESRKQTCSNCGKKLLIDPLCQHYDSFLCAKCAENTPIYASTVVKVEGAYEPYYVLIHKQWYSTLRQKLRWRWRIRGLIG